MSDEMREKWIQANRDAWNEAAPRHRAAGWEQRLERFKRPEFVSLDEIEKPRLLEIGLKGKRIAHLACNSGVELLSMVRLGAVDSVGFDVSDAFIDQAREMASALGLACEFVCSDVYRIDSRYEASFDLVYLSAGTLGWMPDLCGFFEVVARLLKPGGRLFVYEIHPMLDMFSLDPGLGVTPQYSYFRSEPIVETAGLDYVGKTRYETVTKYWFHHKLGDVLTQALKNRFELLTFEEFDHDVSAEFGHLTGSGIKPPMSYIMTARLGDSTNHS